MSWNRKYRPTQVKDLNLDSVRTQITKMMEAGKIPQALLFAGPKGTGKTSTSRIIGALVNDPKNDKVIDSVYFKKEKPSKKLSEPDDKTDLAQKIFAGNSFVVQEMDAASNRGIDDVRQLKAKAFMPPQAGKMSVFILDEAHMLTTEAFNALLKLLEEPPEHVIFILATTELHKIPATVISRCQTIDFKKATEKEIVSTLTNILKAEKIKFDEKALDLIADRADGSFRDAIKLLEMTAQSGQVTLEELEVYSTASIDSTLENLVQTILKKDEAKVVTIFEELRDKNIDQKFFHKSLLKLLHKSLLQNLKVKPGKPIVNQAVAQFLLTQLSTEFLSISSPIQHLPLELKILELIGRSKNKSGKSTSGVKKNPKNVNNSPKVVQNSSKQSSEDQYINSLSFDEPAVDMSYEEQDHSQSAAAPQLQTIQKTDTIATSIPTAPIKPKVVKKNEVVVPVDFDGDGSILCEKWHEFVDVIALKNSTMSSLLRSAKPIDGGKGSATVSVFYSFHKEQLSLTKFSKALQEASKEITGGYVQISFILAEAPAKAEVVEVENTEAVETLAQAASQALM